MFKIDKIIQIRNSSPFHKDPVELKILEMCETLLNFRGLQYVDKTELPAKNGLRRFHVKAAYGTRDK